MDHPAHNDDAAIGGLLSRREALRLLAGAGVSATALGCNGVFIASLNPDGSVIAFSINNAHNAPCVITPVLTPGPFFLDGLLFRPDLRLDTFTGILCPGVAVTIRFNVSQIGFGGACGVLPGALIQVWHCDALGVYSGIASEGTADANFLRGAQLTDANGQATFTTIFPGWYAGRAVHMHFKVRTDPERDVGFEMASQLFFDDRLTDTIHAQPPYDQKGRRDTLNAGDGIFRQGGNPLIVPLAADAATGGYAGTFHVTLRV
jgi:protocatechuate 3,4-dioxygenase beta subunit